MSSHRRPGIRRRLILLSAALIGVLLALTGCSTDASSPAPSTSAQGGLLADHGLAGLDARQIIERLDTMAQADRPTDLIASIRPSELIVRDDQNRSTSLPMPADQFYVSAAPYLNSTHECHFHSLTTCKGELRNADLKVTVTNASGAVLVDKTVRTYDNGFLGLWLPRNIDAVLTVEQGGRSASTPITTSGDETATCLTTLKLV